MDTFQKLVKYSRKVRSGESEVQEILASSIQRLTMKLFIWYDTVDWKNASSASKAVHFFLWGSVYVLWSSVLATLSSVEASIDTIVPIFGTISVSLGGYNTGVRMVEHYLHRDLITSLAYSLNVKVRKAKALCTKDEAREWNQIYLVLLWMLIFSGICMMTFSFLLVVFSLVTEAHFFEMKLPFDRPPHSTVWWMELVFQQVVIVFSALLYTMMEGMMVDCLLQLTFLYSQECKKLRGLSGLDPHCEKKLIAVCRELVELRELHAAFIKCVFKYLLFYMYTSGLMLGAGVVCFALEMRKGILEAISVAFFPFYVLILAAVWTYLGQYFEDAADKLNWSVYNSDWITMNVPTLKVMRMMMALHQRAPQVGAAPFYVMNRETFAEVLKKTYTFYALVRNLYLN